MGLVLYRFGAGEATDAYFLAIALPRFFQVVAHGTVPQVLIPAMAQLDSERTRSIDELLSVMLHHSLLAGLLVYGAAYLGAGGVMGLVAWGLTGDALAQCSTVFRMTALGIALVAPSEILMSHLNSRGVFGRTAGAEALRNGVIAAVVLAASARFGILAAGIGFASGCVVQFFYLLALSLRTGFRWRFRMRFSGPEYRQALLQGAGPTFASAVNFAPQVLQRAFASGVAPGAVTIFSAAQQVVSVLFVVTLRSVGVANHPRLSRLFAVGDSEGANATMRQAMRYCVILGSVSYLCVAFGANDLAGVLTSLRVLGPDQTQSFGMVLFLLSLALPVNGIVTVLRSPHYALNRAQSAAAQMAALGILHVAYMWLLISSTGLVGIAWAQVAWVLTSAIVGYRFLPAACRGLFRATFPFVALAAGSGLGIGIVVFFARRSMELAWLNERLLVHSVWTVMFGGLPMACAAFLLWRNRESRRGLEMELAEAELP